MKLLTQSHRIGIAMSLLVPICMSAMANDNMQSWTPFLKDGTPKSTVWRKNSVGKGEICSDPTERTLFADLERIDQVTGVFSKTDWDTACNIIVKTEGGIHREELTMSRRNCETLYNGTKGFKMRLELVEDHVCEFEWID